MQPKPVDQVVQEHLLVPLYGTERAKKVTRYVSEFLQYRSNFEGALTATFYEAQGRKWLLLACPIVLSGSGGQDASSKISVGVAFPPLFPEKWPYCILNDIGARKLCPDHPYIAANGVIRLQSLPLLASSSDVPPLIDIIVAVQAALSEVAPFVSVLATPVAPLQPAVGTSPTSSPCIGVAAEAQPASPSVAVAAATVLAGATPQRAKLLRAAAEALFQHLLRKQDEFLDTREQFLRYERLLSASQAALQASENSLTEKKRHLLEAERPVLAALHRAQEWKAKYLVAGQALCDPKDAIVATDAANRAALRLQAEVHAYDDAFDVLERALKKGQLSCDEYLRDVSDVARLQFVAKFQLERVLKRMVESSPSASLPQSRSPTANLSNGALQLAQLKAQFASLGSQVVEDVYVNAGCNLDVALGHLTAMTA
jgi:hypothetical protein